MYVGYSADGVHWRCAEKPFSSMLSDTTQSAFWDACIGKYVAYVRARTDKGRSVARMESDDFENWSEPEVVLEGTPSQSLYSMGVTPYQGIYIGTPWVFDQPSEAAGGRVIWPELAVSRDGIAWKRHFPGTPLVPPGPQGSPDSRQIRLASSLVVHGDRILFFYGQTDRPHTTVDMRIDIGMADMRLDGFAAMVAGDVPGEILTPPLAYEAGRLCVNAAVSGKGYVKAELLDRDGEPLPDYALGVCEPTIGDATKSLVRWRGHATVPSSGPEGTRLRLVMKQAELYSFWIEPRQSN